MRPKAVPTFFPFLLLPHNVRAQSNSSLIPASGSDVIVHSNSTISTSFPATNVSTIWYWPDAYNQSNVDWDPTYSLNQTFLNEIFDEFNWTWTVNSSVAPVDGSDQFQALSAASLSWPEGDGPMQDGATTSTCAFGLSTIFTPLGPPLSNGDCSPVFGDDCLYDLWILPQLGYHGGVGNATGQRQDDKCSGTVINIPVPDSCTNVFGNGSLEFIYANMSNGALGLNDPFVMRFVNGTNENSLLTDEYNVVWPLGIYWLAPVMYHDGSMGSEEPMLDFRCLQASNSSENPTTWSASANSTPVNTSSNSNSESVAATIHGTGITIWRWVSTLLAVGLLILTL